MHLTAAFCQSLVLRVWSVCRTFHTFQDDATAYTASPVSSKAAEPNARILSTQDSTKGFLHKFPMPN